MFALTVLPSEVVVWIAPFTAAYAGAVSAKRHTIQKRLVRRKKRHFWGKAGAGFMRIFPPDFLSFETRGRHGFVSRTVPVLLMRGDKAETSETRIFLRADYCDRTKAETTSPPSPRCWRECTCA